MRKLLRTILPIAVVLALSLLTGSVVTHASNATTNPDWASNPRIDAAGDLVVKLLNGSLTAPSHQGAVCAAEPSATGNVQVNCLAEDNGSPQNTQSETSVAASGNKVVVGFNDSLVCCIPALNLTGYSVSTNAGKTFTDMGDVPWKLTVQPIGDPAVAHDASGN